MLLRINMGSGVKLNWVWVLAQSFTSCMMTGQINELGFISSTTRWIKEIKYIKCAAQMSINVVLWLIKHDQLEDAPVLKLGCTSWLSAFQFASHGAWLLDGHSLYYVYVKCKIYCFSTWIFIWRKSCVTKRSLKNIHSVQSH